MGFLPNLLPVAAAAVLVNQGIDPRRVVYWVIVTNWVTDDDHDHRTQVTTLTVRLDGEVTEREFLMGPERRPDGPGERPLLLLPRPDDPDPASIV